MNVLTLILAGGRERRLSILAAQRAKPALPFAGKYRIIDFALSNCVNSGLRRVALLTDYRPQSLLDHVGLGGPWDLDRRRPNGLFIWQPYRDEYNEDLYRGTAGALHQNRRALADDNDLIIVLSGDQVYTMDYRPMIDAHLRNGADLTIGVVDVPSDQTYRFGMIGVDGDQRVTTFEEKPMQTRSTLGSMGVYIFKTSTLLQRLSEDAADLASSHEIGRNLIPRFVQQDNVFAHRFDGYWQDVGNLHVYWQAQLDLLGTNPPLNLHRPDWVIHTRSEERPPVKLLSGAQVQRSLISNGCIVEGQVINSVLSPGVRVARGAVVRDSIVMHDTLIGPEAAIDRCILDENVQIGAGARLGVDEDVRPSMSEPDVITNGLTIVGHAAHIPDGLVAGRNVRIDPEVSAADLASQDVPSGATIMRSLQRAR